MYWSNNKWTYQTVLEHDLTYITWCIFNRDYNFKSRTSSAPTHTPGKKIVGKIYFTIPIEKQPIFEYFVCN